MLTADDFRLGVADVESELHEIANAQRTCDDRVDDFGSTGGISDLVHRSLVACSSNAAKIGRLVDPFLEEMIRKCVSDSDGSGADSEQSCGLRDVTLVESIDDVGSADGVLSVGVVGSRDEADDEVGLQVAETLERRRAGDDISERVTSMGSAQLDEADFELGTDGACRTELTIDPDGGAISATLRNVEVRVVSPVCEAIRFRVVLRDSLWSIDEVVSPTAEGLADICDDVAGGNDGVRPREG